MYSSSAYAPFGEPYAQGGTADLSFTGQDQDTTAGLHDFAFRKYNPVQGRWLSPDPAGLGAVDPSNPQTWNRYGYVVNNPLALTDPLGLCDDTDESDCFSYGSFQGGSDGSFDGGGDNGGSAGGSDGSGGGDSGGGSISGGSAPCTQYIICVALPPEPTGNASILPPPASVVFVCQGGPYCYEPDIGAMLGLGPILRTSSSGFTLGPVVVTTPKVEKPSCPKVALDSALEHIDDFMPPGIFPAGADYGDAAKAAGATAATRHLIQRGLTVPLRSSIVRGLVEFGATAADLVLLVPVTGAAFRGVSDEVKAWHAGTCSTIWDRQ